MRIHSSQHVLVGIFEENYRINYCTLRYFILIELTESIFEQTDSAVFPELMSLLVKVIDCIVT